MAAQATAKIAELEASVAAFEEAQKGREKAESDLAAAARECERLQERVAELEALAAASEETTAGRADSQIDSLAHELEAARAELEARTQAAETAASEAQVESQHSQKSRRFHTQVFSETKTIYLVENYAGCKRGGQDCCCHAEGA